MKRIGYYISEEKSKKMGFESRLQQSILGHDYEIVKMDLSKDLEEQGPFDLIIHKLTSIHVSAVEGDKQALELINRFQTYVEKHPEVIVLNKLSSIANIINRKLQYQLLQDFVTKQQDAGLFLPSFSVITNLNINENRAKLKAANVTYPIICKPMMAQGTAYCHELSLIFCDDGLQDIRPHCVVQSFVNHGGVLFKGFFVGNFVRIVQRPSLRNLSAGNFPTIHFNSHHISKPDSNHFLSAGEEKIDELTADTPLYKRLLSIMLASRQYLGLDLCGVDIIAEEATGKYAIIDVNIFPGYEGVPLFMEKLVEHINICLSDASQSFINTPASNGVHNTKKPRNPETPKQYSSSSMVTNGVDHSASTTDDDEPDVLKRTVISPLNCKELTGNKNCGQETATTPQ